MRFGRGAGEGLGAFRGLAVGNRGIRGVGFCGIEERLLG